MLILYLDVCFVGSRSRSPAALVSGRRDMRRCFSRCKALCSAAIYSTFPNLRRTVAVVMEIGSPDQWTTQCVRPSMIFSFCEDPQMHDATSRTCWLAAGLGIFCVQIQQRIDAYWPGVCQLRRFPLSAQYRTSSTLELIFPLPPPKPLFILQALPAPSWPFSVGERIHLCSC